MHCSGIWLNIICISLKANQVFIEMIKVFNSIACISFHELKSVNFLNMVIYHNNKKVKKKKETQNHDKIETTPEKRTKGKVKTTQKNQLKPKHAVRIIFKILTDMQIIFSLFITVL